jgi:hypothetical protein
VGDLQMVGEGGAVSWLSEPSHQHQIFLATQLGLLKARAPLGSTQTSQGIKYGMLAIIALGAAALVAYFRYAKVSLCSCVSSEHRRCVVAV